MCLKVISERIAGDEVPTRTKAWKVVCTNREPAVYCGTGVVYTDGSEHFAPLARVLGERWVRDRGYFSDPGPRYEFGLHVFTSIKAARDERGFADKIIEVEVSPEDWVADGRHGHALYTRLKVIGEVK
jgi:hypothetical protein